MILAGTTIHFDTGRMCWSARRMPSHSAKGDWKAKGNEYRVGLLR